VSDPVPGATADGAAIYRRLLGYVRPHSGLVALGVLGMVLFAATDVSQALFVNYFLKAAFVEVTPAAIQATVARHSGHMATVRYRASQPPRECV